MTKAVAQPSIRQLVVQSKEKFANRLPKHIDADKFAAIILTEVSRNPALTNCTPDSFSRACMQAAQVGLEPDSIRGLAYLIPYGRECSLVVGYRGLIQLAFRSGMVADFSAHVVYEGEEFQLEQGTESTLRHIPATPQIDAQGFETRKRIGAYSVVKFLRGGVSFEWMFEEEIQAIRKRYSKASNRDAPWNTNPDEMRKKTVVRRHAKFLPQLTELSTAAVTDDAEEQGLPGLTIELGEEDYESALAQAATAARAAELKAQHGTPEAPEE
jgi:recombination protein RecT